MTTSPFSIRLLASASGTLGALNGVLLLPTMTRDVRDGPDNHVSQQYRHRALWISRAVTPSVRGGRECHSVVSSGGPRESRGLVVNPFVATLLRTEYPICPERVSPCKQGSSSSYLLLQNEPAQFPDPV